MKTTRHHTSSAFTLVEVMIVVAIIALLAAIAVPRILQAKSRGEAIELVVNELGADRRGITTVSTPGGCSISDWNISFIVPADNNRRHDAVVSKGKIIKYDGKDRVVTIPPTATTQSLR